MAGEEIRKLFSALMGPFQTLEDTFMALLTQRRVDTAVGVQLDILGKIVGEPRQGQDDDTYRRYVRARIAANNSDGLVEDAIVVTKLVLDESGAYIHVQRIGTATYAIVIEDVIVDTPLAEIVLAFVKDATDAGVRVVVEYWPAVESDLFTFAAFPGQTQLGKGFGSTQIGHTTEGGVFAGSIG